MFRRAHLTGSRRRRRFGRLASLALSLAVIGAPLVVLPAVAQAAVGSPIFDVTDGIADSVASAPDPVRTDDGSNYGQGAKEIDECPSVKAGVAPNKDDLDRIWFGSAPSGDSLFAYMAWHRIATNGTTTVGFELNQLTDPAPDCNDVNPERSVGDVLFTYDFQGTGPFTLAVFAHEWDGSTWVPHTLPSGSWQAGINSDGSFGELVVDLYAAGIMQRNVCEDFAGVFATTRASNSTESEMKDFTVPMDARVSNCGRIRIHKVDDDSPANPLAGATFRLYTDKALEDPVAGATCKTGSDGYCTISNIFPGDYYLHEQITPTGHDTAPDKKVTVSVDTTVQVTFVDKRRPARIDIIKVDDAGARLAGATFGLYYDDGGTIGAAVPDKSCTTDEDGLCSITDILPVGTYWLHETDPPAGHSAAPDARVTLELGQPFEVTFIDDRLPATVDILKTDDTGAVLAGATFGLYEDDDGERGTAVSGKSCTTGASGMCSITGILPPGTYWIHETGVPAGYTAAPDQKVTLGLNQTVMLTFVDERIPATVNIVKTDGAGAALAGATFGLYSDDDGAIGSAVPGAACTTNASGLCSIDGILPPGTYWVHETAVPVGYAAAPDQKVTLDLAATVTLTFVDPKLGPAINVEKTGPSAVHVGDPVVYTLTVTNPGQTDLSSVVVTDSKCDGPPLRSTVDLDGVLSPGETWVYNCTHVATVADGQSILNTVTATGTGPLGDNVSDTASHTTAVLHPAISIVKTANPEAVSVSGPVTYTYVVTNTGDTTLTDVTVTDDILGAIGSVGELAVGASVTFDKTVQVDALVPPRNIGTAVGTDVLGKTVTANDDAVITVVLAAVAELPRTGGPLQAQTKAALMLLQVGIVMALAGRRRRIIRRAD